MSRASDQQYRWRSAHRGKRVYHTRKRAWRAVITTCARNRRLDLRLHPYRCRWKNNYLARDGASGPLHWHIGHVGSSRKARNRRTWLRVHVIWPYYRARRWARSWNTASLRKRRCWPASGDVMTMSDDELFRVMDEAEIATMPDECEHYWASKHEPDHIVYWVRTCMICHMVDWDDLDREIRKAVAERLGTACLRKKRKNSCG